jgi:hypothetical protein
MKEQNNGVRVEGLKMISKERLCRDIWVTVSLLSFILSKLGSQFRVWSKVSNYDYVLRE